jgi:prepilin-type processing-associated H-X9-DG protein
MRYWFPLGVRIQWKTPEVGALLALSHEVWRLIEVNPIPEDQWTDDERAQREKWSVGDWEPQMIVVRPVGVTGEDPRARDHDKHYRLRKQNYRWDVYPDEHYPVCAQCHEPLPCREQVNQKITTAEILEMGRYEVEGMCPTCQELITTRQKTVTFAENVMVPLGPPVTFHLRNGCRSGAAKYDRKLVAAHPTRKPVWFCDGHVENHQNGTYSCTALDACPGIQAEHTHYSVCSCHRWDGSDTPLMTRRVEGETA